MTSFIDAKMQKFFDIQVYEHRHNLKIPPVKTPRFNDQPKKPFQACGLHPFRRLPHFACMKI
ncbi:MAG: hypothetical protein JWQ30_2366, partial [Sediminibacterium sp.]|nr:hypothetical protein [Sediminibacterium sp.]